jgi:hypothetical protein
MVMPPIKVFPDGREVCIRTCLAGNEEYRARTLKMLKRQNGYCCLCNLPLRDSDATFEHQDGRGMGGSRRDDRIEKEGKPYNGAAHGWCNAEKGSRRINYNITTEAM